MFYHGSSVVHDTLKPHPSSLLGGTEVVFATPVFMVALVFSRKWNNEDFTFGRVGSRFYLKELKEGNFERVFLGKKAYVHLVDHRYFCRDKRLGMYEHEFVSRRHEKVHRVEEIDDVGLWLKGFPRLEISSFSGVSFSDLAH